MNALFIELPAFERQRARYFNDDEFRRLQSIMLENPTAGDLIRETGGLRKLRYRDQRRGKCKRGGLRVIYYFRSPGSEFWLFTLYDKDEMADLTTKERAALRALVKRELETRS